jgi:hypothetical protein
LSIAEAGCAQCKIALVDKKSISDLMREWGRKGGKASGRARMVKMTPEQRSEIARKAAAKSAEVRSKKAAAKKKARKNSETK